jgi:hypothetical protein
MKIAALINRVFRVAARPSQGVGGGRLKTTADALVHFYRCTKPSPMPVPFRGIPVPPRGNWDWDTAVPMRRPPLVRRPSQACPTPMGHRLPENDRPPPVKEIIGFGSLFVLGAIVLYRNRYCDGFYLSALV